MFRDNWTKKVGQCTPILFGPVKFKVLFIINPVLLVVVWVLPCFEVPRLVMCTVFFVVFSECSLAYFKSIFFCSRKLHVAIFKSSLVWPSSCISRSNYFFKSLWKIIHLQRKLSQSIHLILKFRRRILSPHCFTFLVTPLKKHLIVPVSSDFNFLVLLFSILNEYTAFKLKSLTWKPAPSFKLNLAFLIRSTKICHRQSLSYVYVHLPD